MRANLWLLSKSVVWGIYTQENYKIVYGPVHTKTIVNANDSKRKRFYAFRPFVHTEGNVNIVE